jgi:hypothetical protein
MYSMKSGFFIFVESFCGDSALCEDCAGLGVVYEANISFKLLVLFYVMLLSYFRRRCFALNETICYASRIQNYQGKVILISED